MQVTTSFQQAIDRIEANMVERSYVIETAKWQGVKLPQPMQEMLNVSFQVMMSHINQEELVKQIQPNLPWADVHFKERIGGRPMNPDPSHEIWPFTQKNNDQHRKEEKFTHTYSERFWPKYAGRQFEASPPNVGIRYGYGDLKDVMALLLDDPFTRQAYIPIWFPEDTGVNHGGRVPCTLGYHIIRRQRYLHIVYYIRSCDLIRHFRDDIYLAVLLVRYIIKELSRIDDNWVAVVPGTYTMHITSLHCFQSDMYSLRKKVNAKNPKG